MEKGQTVQTSETGLMFQDDLDATCWGVTHELSEGPPAMTEGIEPTRALVLDKTMMQRGKRTSAL